MQDTPRRTTIVIASPLEDDQVERIAGFDPDRVEVVHDVDLLPRPRYVADHTGTPRELTEDQLRRWAGHLARADVLFDFDFDDPAALPRRAPNLTWVQGTSAGIGEFLRRTGLDRSGIRFTTASGVHGRSLAEFTMMGLLHFFRGVPHLQECKARKHWERYTVRGLEGSRALVVGLGSLGRAVARDLDLFGVEVWGMRRTADGAPPEHVTKLISRDGLLEAVQAVDALVLACPLTDETAGLIDAETVSALKPGAVVVNISRGAVIDEPALIHGLQSGRISGAALDVFAVEPLPQDNPLWTLPNVIVSPHSASTVAAENRRIVDIFLDNLDRYLSGRPLRNLYEPDRGY